MSKSKTPYDNHWIGKIMPFKNSILIEQDLYEIQTIEDCWNKIGEPEYRTCLFPGIWNHRFGLITFYPEWEENGLNILIRNGKIIGYNNGIDPIIKAFDNPELKSVY